MCDAFDIYVILRIKILFKLKKLYNQFCTGLVQRQKFNEAVRWCERYASVADSYAANLLLGRTYHQVGQNDAASAAIQKAQQIDPARPQAYFNLAEVRKAQGELEAARSLLDTSLSLDPTNHRAAIALIEILTDLGESEIAKKKLQELI